MTLADQPAITEAMIEATAIDLWRADAGEGALDLHLQPHLVIQEYHDKALMQLTRKRGDAGAE